MTLLTVADVHVRFVRKAGLLARLRRSLPPIHAVDGVSFEVAPGEVLGVAGGSGSGKSSLAFAIMGHHPLHGGTITVAGQPVIAGDRARLRRLRRDVQLIFQDPYQSLNPLFDIERVVSEPLRIMAGTSGTALRSKVVEALGLAGLRPPEKFLARYPHELSGGQRQRVAIARAIIVEPKLLIADEPTSMLDVSVRAGILKLLAQHAHSKRIGILYISHDLATMKQICDRIAVMHRGRIVEIGAAEEVITHPKHDYTRSLIAAVPNFRFET